MELIYKLIIIELLIVTFLVYILYKITNKKHKSITIELINILNNNKELKSYMIKSIRKANKINPDKKTNPVKKLKDLYNFIDYSITCMPWNILETSKYELFTTRCDQSLLYLYWLLDQPLDELKDKNLYFPSIEYLEPIYNWIKNYNNTWKEFLDSEASWKEEYYNLLLKEKSWNLDKDWYEDKNNWHSFNDFFARKLKNDNARPISSVNDDTKVIAPADSLPQGTWKIDSKGIFLSDPLKDNNGIEIKSSDYYSVEQLLGNNGKKYAKNFYNGTITHTFLNYDDYHRYHIPVSGKIIAKYIIPNANNLGGIVYWDNDKKLYTAKFNSLSWQTIETRGCVIIETSKYGLVAVLPIGMGQVSSVNFENEIQVGKNVKKGDPLGYFLFGGSDCVMIFEEKANFKLTVSKSNSKNINNNGYKHILCREEYGEFCNKD